MRQTTRHISIALAPFAALLLSVGLLTQAAFAANTISTTAPTSISLGTNAATGTGAYSPLSADIAFSAGAAADLAVGSVVSITAPAGWSFNPALSGVLGVTYGAGATGPAFATVTPTTISTTLTGANTGAGVAVTFDTSGANLVIRPDTATSATGNLTGQTTLGTPLAATSAGTITAVQAATPTPTPTATATPTPSPTPTPTCGFIGTAPGSGSIALLVTSGTCTAAGLVSALGAANCTVESLAILEGGVWKIHINGAPAIVNAAFPATLAPTTAFFVRCQA